MKLLPYTTAANAIPAMTLVAANVTVMYGPAVQLVAVFAVFGLMAPKLQIDLRGSWILIAYIGLCLAAGLLAYGSHQAVIKAGKLAVFCMASALAVKGASRDNSFPALVALRVFLGLCAMNLLYAVTTGNPVFRGAYLIEFSIYSSYTIAILVYLARPQLTAADRACAWIFSLLCGSTTGLLVLMLAELVGRRFGRRMLIGFAALTPVGLYVLNLLMQARGKELTWAFLANSDRARILGTFQETILPTFTTPNWLFGLGPGYPMHGFVATDPGFQGYLLRLGEGEIYSFCLHSEALRILCDFGLVGLLLVVLRLWANCPGPVLFLLGICMLTNSYIYSFSGALVASSLFNPQTRDVPEPATAFKPSLSHA